MAWSEGHQIEVWAWTPTIGPWALALSIVLFLCPIQMHKIKCWQAFGEYRIEIGAHSDSFGKASTLNFALSIFSLNGTWMGFHDLSHQFQLCEYPWEKQDTWNKVGVNFNNKCKIGLDYFLKRNWERMSEPLFYDVYLRTGVNQLYPVPILILGPDDSESEILKSPYKHLVRRMFLVDGLSARENENLDPSVVRYAQEVSLSVQLREDGLIYPPLITVRWQSWSKAPIGSFWPQ